MKLGILLKSSPKMGGGFFQSLKSTLTDYLTLIKYNPFFEIIVTDTETKKYLPKFKSKFKLYIKRFSNKLSSLSYLK